MIRPAEPTDVDPIVSIAQETGLFEPEETDHLRRMLDEHFAGGDGGWLVAEEGGEPIGVAFYAREEMAKGTWNLYMLAVRPDHQAAGHGGRLVRHVEDALSQAGERMLLIETSSQPAYSRARAFYERLGYTEEARLRDFYDAGDDKVVFRKALGR